MGIFTKSKPQNAFMASMKAGKSQTDIGLDIDMSDSDDDDDDNDAFGGDDEVRDSRLTRYDLDPSFIPEKNLNAKKPKFPFKVEVAQQFSQDGKRVVGEHYVVIMNPRHSGTRDLIDRIIYTHGGWSGMFDEDEAHKKSNRRRDRWGFNRKPVAIPLALFMGFLGYYKVDLKNNLTPVELLPSFIDMLDYYYHEVVSGFMQEKEKGLLSFEAVMFFMLTARAVAGRNSLTEPTQAMVLPPETIRLQRVGDLYCVDISGLTYAHSGTNFYSQHHTMMFASHKNETLYKKTWEEHKVWPVTEREEERLRALGAVYVKCATEPTHMHYHGEMTCRIGIWNTTININSRVVVDMKNFFNQDQVSNQETKIVYQVSNQERKIGDERTLDAGSYLKLPKKLLPFTVPIIQGFSLKTKQWGMMRVDCLKEVVYDESAYDYLVLDEKKKKVIKCFVQDHFQAEGHEMDAKNTSSPIVLQKSQGKVFLLQGPCGTGKTLTAEAISDLVKCPLYSIAVGELGCDPMAMEKKLSSVLNLATQWKAVVLIDEADIFLERRTTADIQRNALVGIFLRVLEYYRGILFLTTNRINAFDEAFFSRCSVNLYYPALDFEMRKEVMISIIKQMDLVEDGIVTPRVFELLNEYQLNGRTIKTALSLAKTLAVSDGSPHIKSHHLEQTLVLVSNTTTNALEVGNLV